METQEKTTKKKSFWGFRSVFALIFWLLFLVGVGAVFSVFIGINKGWFGYLPPIEELQNPKNTQASEIFTEDNVSMGRYYLSENRLGVQYDDISEYMIKALVATEDARFYKHSGIDAKAFLRAAMSMGKAGGGSTLTQQLAKQLYTQQEQAIASSKMERVQQKLNEWVIATKLEHIYAKEEILTMYLNQFDFLYNAIGIKSAAFVYFGVAPKDLKLEQAAMLVGMCKNPSLYNPIKHPERAMGRRNTVLEQMLKYGYITPEECDSVKQLDLNISYHSVDHKQGLAPYFRVYLQGVLMAKEPKEENYPSWKKAQYALDKEQWDNNPLYGWCNKTTKPDGTPYSIYKDGLKIYTTLDSRMQRYAEEAVDQHMRERQEKFWKEKKGRANAPFSISDKFTKADAESAMNRAMKDSERYRSLKAAGMSAEDIKKNFGEPVRMQVFTYDGMKDTVMTPMDSIRWMKSFLRCGFMSMDPHNGHVKAYVGGPNFAAFQFDMVNQGKRQVGSTVKPYLYTLAMSEGFCPNDKVVNEPITLKDDLGREWSPRNSDKNNIGDTVTLRWGLQHSNNWISAYLMSQFTPEQFVKMLRSFGIEGQLDPVVSLCLGPCEISVREMVSAYTAFPNKGIRTEPLYVTRIEDSKGNIIARFDAKTHEVIDEKTSYKMIHMMQAVMEPGGTGNRVRRIYGIHAPMAGKTGTTNNNSDAWFMNYTPSLVSGCWTGGEDKGIHFSQMSEGQGASMALPLVALYMQKVYADPSLGYDQNEQFDIPDDFDPNEECNH